MNQKFLDFAKQVTSEIVEELKEGNAVWQKPWKAAEGARNYATGRAYEGFNQFYLSYISEKRGYPTNLYLSFQQAKTLGGYVRKGERSAMVIYWKVGLQKTGKTITDAQGNETDQTKKLFFPFIHYVFNIAQIDGVEFTKVKAPAGNDNPTLQSPEQIISNMPQCPAIETGGDIASYHPLFDVVKMPDRKYFISSEAYYGCLFHELIHSTGHSKRLNRFDNNTPAYFGSDSYSREELIAEMGVVYLSSYAGIATESLRKNSTAYLQGWMKSLQDDPTLIITAANKAQKATAFILALSDSQEGKEGQENSLSECETIPAVL